MPLFHTGDIIVEPTLESNYADDDVLFAPVMIGEERRPESQATAGSNIGYLTDMRRNFVASVERIGVTWGVEPAPAITLIFFEGNPSSFGAMNEPCAINESDLRTRLTTIIVPTTAYSDLNSLSYVDITGDGIGRIYMNRNNPLYLAGIINENYSGNLSNMLHLQINLEFVGERVSN